MTDHGVSTGRGRGRGRGSGGVPVLPAGMWTDVVVEDNREPHSDGDHAQHTVIESDATDMQGVDAMQFSSFGGGRGRGRGGRGAAGRGRGFEKDAKGPDWECPSCANVNWSWRASCNRCSTAKPAALITEAEVRDGIGGGFNERQERASAGTLEIAEDGFDDFGRRAKGGRKDRTAKEMAALARLNNNYGFLMNPKVDVKDGRYDDAEEPVSSSNPKAEERKTDEERNRTRDSAQRSSRSRSGGREGRRRRSRSRERDDRRHSRRDREGSPDARSRDRDRSRHDRDRRSRSRERRRR